METIKLDLIPGKKMPSLHASQYDDGREHGIDLFENGIAYKLDGTETLTINERKVDNNICSMDIENTFTGSSHIEFASFLQMCACAGSNFCELRISKGGVDIGTLNFILEVEPDPTADGIESESEIRNLERQIEEITEEVIGDDYYTAEETDEAIATATEGKADATYVDTELAKKADKTNTYTKTQVDNALNNKMDKANPTGTGSFSLNRKNNTIIGNRSFVEGYNNEASGSSSHSEGYNNISSGDSSHSEGSANTAIGIRSHAEGNGSIASGTNSHSEGRQTIANHLSQHVFGEFNIADDSTAQSGARGKYIEIVGNGTADNVRNNARTLDWQGNETLAGDLIINGNQSVSGEITRLDGRIDNLPAPMIFKGTLGVGGTIQTLPAASASNEGWTYKVITDGTYAGQNAKVGDVFTSNGSAWVYIPSGDEDNDTWRAIKVNGVEKLGNGISSGAVDFVGSENIEVEFDGNGNKVGIKTKNIYTESEVDELLDDKADKSDTYTKAQVDAIIDSILPTDSASGAIASFKTSLAKPIEFEAEFGADENGVSQIKIVQTGSNIFNGETESGSFDTTTGEKTANNNLVRSVNPIAVKPGETYMRVIDASLGFRVFYYDENMQFISTAASQYTQLAITIPNNCYYINIAYQKTISQVSFNYPSTDTSFNAYNSSSNVETISLGSAYYNGGKLTQDKEGHRTVTADGVTTNLPDGTPKNALIGTNNIWADTGDTEVVFKSSVNDYVSAHSGGNLLGMGGVYLGGAKSGGSEEEPTEEEPKEVTKTLGDEPISKK